MLLMEELRPKQEIITDELLEEKIMIEKVNE